MKNHIESIIPKLRKIVSPDFCKKMALKTGFVKRSTSRLDGYEFVKTLILGSANDSLYTYKRRITKFKPTANLSVPALAQRINQESSVILMLSVLSKCLTNLYEKKVPTLRGISRILIQDSTCIPLNKALADIYSGCGGHHKNAGIKIDCTYDYSSETILDIQHYARTTSDCVTGDIIFKYLESNDLVISDLGYFKLERFRKIEKSEAFYVSRLKTGLSIYESPEKRTPVCLVKFLKKKLKNNTIFDRIVYLGAEKIKTRLIVNKLPEEVVNEKLRKANRDAQVRRTQLSDEKRMLLSYTILITNLPEDIATTEEVLMLYRIRWRIELVFKEWKSQIKIGNITGKNIFRIKCLIFARMCLLLILNKFTSYLSGLCLKLYGKELSVKKTLDFLLEDGNLLKLFSKGGLTRILKAIKKELCQLGKSKRRKRKTTLQILMESSLAA